LKGRFSALIGKKLKTTTISNQPLSESFGIKRVLYIWEHEGIEKAMKLYYSNIENNGNE